MSLPLSQEEDQFVRLQAVLHLPDSFLCHATNETGFFVRATSIRLGQIPMLHKYA